MTNYYLKVLELEPGATERDIKKAYRRLAKKYHPDTSRHPDAEIRFLEITEAYEFLSRVGPTPNEETTSYEYDPFAQEYEARRAQARAYAQQRAAEAARDRYHTLQRFYRILTPLVLVAGLFNILLVVDYVVPDRHSEENIRRVYRIFERSGRTGGENWSYDAIEFEQFTLQVGKGEAVDRELPNRGTVVVTPLLNTVKYASLPIRGEEERFRPAYSFYRVFVYLIPAILLGCFFYFRLPDHNENKLAAALLALFACIIQLFLF